MGDGGSYQTLHKLILQRNEGERGGGVTEHSINIKAISVGGSERHRTEEPERGDGNRDGEMVSN